ncbi:MAG: hypothetical protein ABSD13_16325 [Candidatus Korobacteraceae bacterium]
MIDQLSLTNRGEDQSGLIIVTTPQRRKEGQPEEEMISDQSLQGIIAELA